MSKLRNHENMDLFNFDAEKDNRSDNDKDSNDIQNISQDGKPKSTIRKTKTCKSPKNKKRTKEWKSIYNAEKNKYDGYNKEYAVKSVSEYFAESYKDYKENPSALKSKRPRTYQFVKSTIDGITESDVQNIKDTYGEYWGL